MWCPLYVLNRPNFGKTSYHKHRVFCFLFFFQQESEDSVCWTHLPRYYSVTCVWTQERARPVRLCPCFLKDANVLQFTQRHSTSALFTDSYSEIVPGDGPPSFRGQSVKYVYKLTIGCQRVNSPIKLLRVPFRVLVLQGQTITLMCHTCGGVVSLPQV